ncbi:hypothetical protein H7I76_12240, partial [Mycolicibacterium vaccae]|nr:hypothetical protein [Mycolicibacterium vaccae]
RTHRVSDHRTRSRPPVPALRHRTAGPARPRPDLGALSEPARRGACLTGLGYPPGLDVLGGTQLETAGRPAVVLVLDGATPAQVSAVVVPPTCNAAHTGLLAETAVARP